MAFYKNIALIVAAGVGNRAGDLRPKQYLEIQGQTLLEISISRFLDHPQIDAVMVVINSEHVEQYVKATKGLDLLPFVIGGEQRQDSVRLGLMALEQFRPETVLIHDAARIFVTDSMISELLEEIKNCQGVIPVCTITDTIKQIDNKIIQRTLPRNEIFGAQTPQVFKYKTILNAHLDFEGRYFTDDASLLEQLNIPVKVAMSDNSNFKITTARDFMLAKLLLGKSDEN